MDRADVVDDWANRTGIYSPGYYAYQGSDEASEAVHAALEATVGADARVLEVGCSAGRNLAHLHDHGYTDLHGVDVNADAFDVMAETYPALWSDVTVYHDAVEDVVADVPDGHFDAVYSVETLQHLHADSEWVFEELVRVTDDVLVTVENEGDVADRDGEVQTVHLDEGFPLYHRDWGALFTDLGLVEFDSRSLRRDTFRAFRVPE